MARSTKDRILQRVEVVLSGCWLWTGATSRGGYGAIFHNGSARRAHRVSYEVFVGPIPDGLCVCHRCDNPRCVNPQHMFLGTNAENTADKVAKSRHARGATHGNAKLGAEDVATIRSLLSEGAARAELATRFNVSKSLIDQVQTGKVWREQ